MNRRNFFKSLGLASAGALFAPSTPAASTSTPAAPTAPSAPGTSGFVAMAPFAQYRGAGLVDLRWRVTAPSDFWVEMSQDPAADRGTWKRVKMTRDGLVFRHITEACVTLRHIDIAKPLLFEAFARPKGKSEAVSVGKGTLRPITAPDGAVRLAFMNDIHGNTKVIPMLLQLKEVDGNKPGAVVFNGDCLDDCGSREGAEKRFLHALSDVTARGYHIIYLRGNHEYRGRMAPRIRECVSPFASGEYYDVLQLGDLRMACLDTGEDKPDSHRGFWGNIASDVLVAEQGGWLRDETESAAWKASPRKIAVMHIPPRSGIAQEERWHRATNLRALMDKTLNASGIAALIGAHTHVYKYLPIGNGGCPYPTVVGGGPSVGSATVILMDASKKAFTLAAYRTNGKELLSADALK